MKISVPLMSRSEQKVWRALLDGSDTRNTVRFTQKEIADRTGLSAMTVSRAFRVFQKATLLQNVRHACWMLNPQAAWPESMPGKQAALRAYLKLWKKWAAGKARVHNRISRRNSVAKR